MEIHKIRPIEAIRTFLTGSELEKKKLAKTEGLSLQRRQLNPSELDQVRTGKQTRLAIDRRRFIAAAGILVPIILTTCLSSTNTESETDDDVVDKEVKKQGIRLNPTERNRWTQGVFKPYSRAEVTNGRMTDNMVADETDRRFYFVIEKLMPNSTIPSIKGAIDYITGRQMDIRKPREEGKDLIVELGIRNISTQRNTVGLEPRLDSIRVAWIIRPYAAFILTSSPVEIALEIVLQTARIKRYKQILEAMDSSRPITDRKMELDTIFSSEPATEEAIAYAAAAQAYIETVGQTGIRNKDRSNKAANFIKR